MRNTKLIQSCSDSIKRFPLRPERKEEEVREWVLKEIALLFDVMDEAMYYTLNTVSRWDFWEIGTGAMKVQDINQCLSLGPAVVKDCVNTPGLL